MRRSRCQALAAALTAVWVAACGAEKPHPRSAAVPALIDEATPTPPGDQTAVWWFHPAEAAKLRARLPLADSRQLFAGARGERWLADHGKIRAAARLAPETLVGIVPPAEGSGYLFVGESGTGYESREPLGPFVRSGAPPEPLVSVAAAGSALLGVRRNGGLFLSEDRGATYAPVGPERRFVGAVFDASHTAYALAVPERLWRSSDLGRTWTELGQHSIGAYSLVGDDPAHVQIRSVLGDYTIGSDGTLSVRQSGLASLPPLALDGALPRGPDATAIADGRAALTQNRYYEVERDPKKVYRLWYGTFDEPLTSRPLPLLEGCEVVRVGAFGRFVYVACARTMALRAEQPFVFYASRDAGKTFDLEPFQVQGVPRALVMAVGDEGRLLVTGVCAAGEKVGCARGVFYRQLASQRELARAATPSLRDTALALAFAERGTRAYAVANRTKAGGLALYVSSDRGKTFEAHDLDEGPSGPPDDSATSETGPSGDAPSTAAAIALTPASDGSVSIVLNSPPVVIVADEAGRVQSVSRSPEPGVLLAAVGTRALAVSASADDQRTWESLDGGVSWQSIGRAPLALCPNERCAANVRCGSAGCVLGSELSRIGWQGQADDDSGVLAPPEPAEPRLFRHKLGVGFSCNLDDPAWHSLASTSSSDGLPEASGAAIGRAAWLVYAWDKPHAAVFGYHGIGGSRPRVDKVTLLAPVPNPADWASVIVPQIEGVGALRYLVPERHTGDSHLSDVEVAWDNLVENTVGHATLPSGASFDTGDYRRDGRYQTADPHLVSVASGGIYVRIHHSRGDSQPTYFFDAHGSTTTIPAISWPEPGIAASSEVVRVGAQHVPIRIFHDGAGLARAELKGQGFEISAMALGLLQPQRFGVEQSNELAYVSTGIALVVSSQDPARTEAHAAAYPIRGSGPVVDAAIPLPTQLDVGDSPRRCTADQRGGTPRFIADYAAGTRHLVQVLDNSEPMRTLLTERAVLHGTPQNACVDAYDAVVVPVDPPTATPEERAILPYDDLEHSWLFRRSASTEGGIEYRAMTCHADSTLEPPPNVFRLGGTLAE